MVGLERVWSDGTWEVVFFRAELVERLVALVPSLRHPRMRLAGERVSWSDL